MVAVVVVALLAVAMGAILAVAVVLFRKVLQWMRKQFKIQTIGPTVPSMYTDKRLLGNYDYGLSFFKPKIESFIKWLDNKEDLSEKQKEEVASGLIQSKCHFLWALGSQRNGTLQASSVSRLRPNRELGGWNSTLEAIVLGVPMVVMLMPQYTDQPTNAKLVADVWRTGVRVKADANGIVMRDEVAARLNEVMQRGRGDEMRRNVLKWKNLAIEAVSKGGRKDLNIAEFVDQLVSTFRNIHKQKSDPDAVKVRTEISNS
ncbi:hypothetical protein C2S52_015215 [Perilla frutescens var. hirtella]|nr:hypothetical protein C2S52_015215 [Perilla frutescens var. hirtella]